MFIKKLELLKLLKVIIRLLFLNNLNSKSNCFNLLI
jgi:hypothetical protein